MSTTKGGCMIYKCRLCGGFEQSLHAPSAFKGLLDGLHGTNSFPGSAIRTTMLSIHQCVDGKHGVTDLVGAVEDKDDK